MKLFFIIVSLFVSSVYADAPAAPSAPTKPVEPTKPILITPAEQAVMPPGMSPEDTIKNAHKSSLEILKNYLRDKGISFEARGGVAIEEEEEEDEEELEKKRIKVSIENILSYFRSVSPEPGKTLAFLADKYHEYMGKIEKDLLDKRKYMAMTEKQISGFVNGKFREFGYFAEIDANIKGK
jgi:hypothetical protein